MEEGILFNYSLISEKVNKVQNVGAGNLALGPRLRHGARDSQQQGKLQIIADWLKVFFNNNFELKLQVFVMVKTVSNMDICFIKAKVIIVQTRHFNKIFRRMVNVARPPQKIYLVLTPNFHLGWRC